MSTTGAALPAGAVVVMHAAGDWSELDTVTLSPHHGLFATPDAPSRTDGVLVDTAIELYGRYHIHRLARMSGLLTFADLDRPDRDLLAELGPLELLVGGIEFDTGLWSVDGLDVDNDGDEDDGYVGGYQLWGRGAMLAVSGHYPESWASARPETRTPWMVSPGG